MVLEMAMFTACVCSMGLFSFVPHLFAESLYLPQERERRGLPLGGDIARKLCQEESSGKQYHEGF